MMNDNNRRRNFGFRKGIGCDCGRRRWPTCPHSYYLNYRGVRVSLDREAGRHLDTRDATTLASQLRIEIDDARSRGEAWVSRHQRGTTLVRPDIPPPLDPGGLTVDEVGKRYFSQARNRLTGQPLQPRERANWNVFADFVVRHLGRDVALKTLPAGSVTHEHVCSFYEQQAVVRQAVVKNAKDRKRYTRDVGGPTSANRTGDRAMAIFKWAASHASTTGVSRSPFRDAAGDRVAAKHGEQARERRLEAGEEDALIQHATPTLRLCIIAAIESVLRLGELLSLRWRHVDLAHGVITLRGKSQRRREGTKTRRGRVIPITARMRVVLEFLQIGPDGKPHHEDAYVFGDGTTGEKRRSLSTAWDTCRLRASGFTGQLREGEHHSLTSAARAHLKDYDLQWRDLRREGASAHVDRGMRLPEAQEMLGHASLATTSRYVKPKGGWTQDAAKRVDQHPENVNNLQKLAKILTVEKEAKFGPASKSVN